MLKIFIILCLSLNISSIDNSSIVGKYKVIKPNDDKNCRLEIESDSTFKYYHRDLLLSIACCYEFEGKWTLQKDTLILKDTIYVERENNELLNSSVSKYEADFFEKNPKLQNYKFERITKYRIKRGSLYFISCSHNNINPITQGVLKKIQ
jgi:hypothetical protein